MISQWHRLSRAGLFFHNASKRAGRLQTNSFTSLLAVAVSTSSIIGLATEGYALDRLYPTEAEEHAGRTAQSFADRAKAAFNSGR